MWVLAPPAKDDVSIRDRNEMNLACVIHRRSLGKEVNTKRRYRLTVRSPGRYRVMEACYLCKRHDNGEFAVKKRRVELLRDGERELLVRDRPSLRRKLRMTRKVSISGSVFETQSMGNEEVPLK